MPKRREKFPGFKACMKMMRKHNPQIQEEGFHALLPHAAEFVEELIQEFLVESDHGLRCWLLELLGETRDARVQSLFVEHLESEDESFRYWAIEGLKALNTKEAKRTLFEHTKRD